MSDGAEWALYAEHRAHLTDAIVQSKRAPSGRLCILGAGACNDVDLERLANEFSEIHLVDIAPKALAGAVARQPAPIRASLVRHAPVDLSGFTPRRLTKWKRFVPPAAEVAAAATASIQSIVAQLPGPFDVVVSACVLTQMSFDLRKTLTEGHPLLAQLRLVLTEMHLRTLAALTSANGALLFACDATSSTHYPLSELPPEKDLHEVLADAVRSGASYHSANPDLVRSVLLSLGEPHSLDPWLWTAAFDRTYLVYAIRLTRS